MPVVACTDILPASAEALFDLSQDYARRFDWDPFPESYRFLPPHDTPQPGALLVVRARNGHEMTVRYIGFNRPRAAAVEMVRGPWFIAKFAGTWRFDAIGPERTRVTFKYNLVAGPRALAWLIQPLLERVFARHTRRRLAALHRHVASHVPRPASMHDRDESASP